MGTWIEVFRRWGRMLAAALPADEPLEQRRRAHTLYWTLRASLILVALIALMEILRPPETRAWEGIVFSLLAMGVIVAGLLLLRRGKATHSAALTAGSAWLIFTLDLALFSGIEGSSALGQVAIIFMAGLVLGRRVILPMTLATALADYAILTAQTSGLSSGLVDEGATAVRWFLNTIYMLIAGVFAWLAEAGIAAALGEARRNAQRYQALFDQSSDAILMVDLDGRIETANANTAALLGAAGARLEGSALLSWIDPDWDEEAREVFGRLKAGKATATFEALLVNTNGDRRVVEINATRVENAGGQAAYIQTILRDVTERKHVERSLQHRALHDGLTGLANREYFDERVQAALEQLSPQQDGCLAVMFVDLDNFKEVNDSHGHAVGDEVLKIVAKRLVGNVRSSDRVARLGGDEFGILLTHLSRPENMEAVAGKLLQAIRAPIYLEALAVRVTGSIGYRVYSGGETTAAMLLRQADRAMYRAKQAGKDRGEGYAGEEVGEGS